MIAVCMDCAFDYADDITEEVNECERDFGIPPMVMHVAIADCQYHPEPEWTP